MEIIKPIYINNYEVINPLYEQFGDTSVKFYKTSYLISEEYYKPQITQIVIDGVTYYNHPTMPRLKSGDNTLIFPKRFNYSKYRLLSEELERQERGDKLLIVHQTWGYTPDMVFSQPATVSWQKPGLYDVSNVSVTRNLEGVTTDEATKTHQVFVDNSDGYYAPGNIVRIMKAYYSTGMSWKYRQVGEYVTIQSVTADRIIIPFFKSTSYDGSNNVVATIDSNDPKNGIFVTLGLKYVEQSANVRNPVAGDFPCEMRSQFITINTSDDLINIQPAWTVELGGQPTDTLSSATVPTLSDYNSKIGTKEKLLATSESLTRLIGNVYIRQGNYVKYQ